MRGGDYLSNTGIYEPRWFYCSILIAMTTLCYVLILRLGFLIIDDPLYVTNNPHVLDGLTWESIKWAFLSIEAEFWHPLTWLSLMLDATLYGTSPLGYHSTNLLLHMAACIFLFLAFDVITGRRRRAFIMAALFAVHPFHVEAVAWVAERKEVLCGFFWAGALLAYAVYVKKPGLKKYLILCGVFACGLMAKPMIVTLPFVFLLLDFWPLRRFSPASRQVNSSAISRRGYSVFPLMEKIPLLMGSAAAIGLTLYAQHAGMGIVDIDVYPLATRLANAVVAYKTYLLKTFYPVDLAIFYPFQMNLSYIEIISSIAVLFCVSFIAMMLLHKQPYLAAGWFWFLGTLVPVIGIIKIGDFAMADRYMYMPITGLLFASVWLAFDIAEKFRITEKFFLCLSAVAVVILLFTTQNYLYKWQDNKTLFKHTARVAAPNYFAHYALGQVYAGEAKMAQAEKAFKRAVTLRPDKSTLHLALGRIVGVQGRFSEAVSQFQEALKLKKNDTEARFYLGLARAGSGRRAEAVEQFIRLLRSSDVPKEPHLLSLQARLTQLYRKGEFLEALNLLGVNASEAEVKKQMAKGFDKWKRSAVLEQAKAAN